jgi:hypothetical protein
VKLTHIFKHPMPTAMLIFDFIPGSQGHHIAMVRCIVLFSGRLPDRSSRQDAPQVLRPSELGIAMGHSTNTDEFNRMMLSGTLIGDARHNSETLARA